MTEVCTTGVLRRFMRCAASGGGAATELSNRGTMRLRSAAGVSGAGGIARRGLSIFASDVFSDQATMSGSAMSRFNLIFGGVTMVCERLSASRGTEMIGCRETSGSAFAG